MISHLPFILRRRWPILVVLPVVGGLLGFLFAPSGSGEARVTFQATGTVAVSQDLNQTQVNQQLIEVRFNEVAEATAEAVGGDATVTKVARVITSSFDPASYTVTFQAEADRADTADAYLEAFLAAFVEQVNPSPAEGGGSIALAEEARDRAEEELNRFIFENQDELNAEDPARTVLLRFEDLQVDLQQAEAELTQRQAEPEAETPYRVINRTDARARSNNKLELPADRLLRITLGVLLGLLAAVGVAAVIERMNPRIDDPDQATELIGAPVLAMVPKLSSRDRGLLDRMDPDRFRGPFAEAHRSIRTHLDFRAQAEGREEPPTVLITSATPGEGKSTTVAALAMAHAEAGRSPLVIAADLRRPSVHETFDIDRVPGLSSRATVGGQAVPLSEIVKKDPTTGVSMVPSGPAVDRVTGLVEDIAVIAKAANRSGRPVLVDTPPVLVANDATDFLSAVDWVVLVVRIGSSTRRSVAQTVQTLRLNRAEIVGVIVIGSTEASDAARYYSSYYAHEGDADRIHPVAERGSGTLTTTGSLDDG